MTDRELLDLAAKAAGLFVAEDIDGSLTEYFCEEPFASAFEWDPLQDDGDALRLAVTLQIRCEPIDGYGVAYAGGRCAQMFTERHTNDEFSAQRRAIVRAAAEIGKTL